ncbi:LysE family translocator [Burkholderiaceae bacterium DAT-1]|nr:LysE family translocator [Burkholderiaceae bacterium DAT-1]
MIDLHLMPLFLAAVFALMIVPGPDMLLIVGQSMHRGRAYGLACAFGIFLAGGIQTVLVALGLGRVMELFPLVGLGVRLAGAFYLAWMGLKMVRAWATPVNGVATETVQPRISMSRMVVAGIVNNLLNPKALLFFSMFLPQFVTAHAGPASTQLLIWGALLSSLALAFNIALAVLAAAARTLAKPFAGMQRHAEGWLGVLFVGLAARLAWAKSA